VEKHKSHQLARMAEAPQIAEFGDEGEIPRKACRAATTGARRHVGTELAELLAEPRDAGLGLGAGIAIFLEGDVLGWVRKAQIRQPASVRQGPSLSAGIPPTLPQQEALSRYFVLGPHAHRVCARTRSRNASSPALGT
jgi:hypothetical protein